MMQRLAVVAMAAALPLSGCLGTSGDDPDGDGPGADGLLAAFTATPQADGRTFTFDADASRGTDLTYAWSFGDGGTGSGKTVSHAYDVGDGLVAVVLTVTDASGASDVAVQGIVLGVADNGEPVPAVTASTDWTATGSPVSVKASAVDPDGDDVTIRIGTGFLGAAAPPALIPSDGGGHAHDHSDPSYTPAANGFDSPMFPAQGSYNLTLTEPGVYTYHCHPHPWMTGTVVVGDTPGAAEGNVTLTAWNVKAFLPATVFVKPGTRLTWENPDPAPHTVTLSTKIPVTSLVESGDGTAAFSPEREGVYGVVALATDSKGVSAVTHTLVKASRVAPMRVIDQNFTGELQAPVSDPVSHPLALDFPGTAQIGFTWTSQSPPDVSAVRLDVFAGDEATGSPIATSNGEPLTLQLAAGSYLFRVTNEQALLVQYTVHVRAVLDVKPDFGPSGGGGGHHH